MKSVIIGSGNVASILGRKILEAGHEIYQVAGRNTQKVKLIAEDLNCTFTDDLRNISRTAELYLVAISDEALPDLHKVLHLDHAIVVHTAGSIGMNVLSKVSMNYGVLYPLQSLRTGMPVTNEIPLIVDGNTAETLTLIYDFAETISGMVTQANDEQRLRYHLAAVLSNNFSNRLFTLTEEFCKNEKLDFLLLRPLINETVSRLQYQSPGKLQTGPAARKDINTINSHLELLSEYPGLKRLYQMMTESILSGKNN
jgi:predicted short-subunit dehydrogenase-like oxidoreductase (DUF2520 family)